MVPTAGCNPSPQAEQGGQTDEGNEGRVVGVEVENGIAEFSVVVGVIEPFCNPCRLKRWDICLSME